MSRVRAVFFAVVLMGLALPPTASGAADELTCNGKKVTASLRDQMTNKGDFISGTPRADVINGLGGNDAINGRGGDDVICGGPDKDVVDFTGGPAVVANLSTGVAVAGNDRIKLIDLESVFGSENDDKLTGDSGGNNLSGSGGDDELSGSGGKDQLIGHDGDDTFFPGSGVDSVSDALDRNDVDTLSYRNVDGAVRVRTAAFPDSVFEYGGRNTTGKIQSIDTLSGNFQAIEGSKFNDELNGSDLDEVIFGLGGHDVLDGKGGTDGVVGGTGDDRLIGGTGRDNLNGGPNNPVKSVHARGDVADYQSAPEGVDANLGTGRVQVFGGAGEDDDILIGIESVTGSPGDTNWLFGNDGPNVLEAFGWYDQLFGEGGDDSLAGGRREDLLVGGSGADHLDGDAGQDDFSPGAGDDIIVGGDDKPCDDDCAGAFDQLIYDDAAEYGVPKGETSPSAVVVDLDAGTAATGLWGTDTFVEIEGVYGGDFDDVLKGDVKDNFLSGRGGNDTMEGGDGDDVIYGDEGTDSADGGGGSNFCSNVESRTNCQQQARIPSSPRRGPGRLFA